jgi:hypothetical protein
MFLILKKIIFSINYMDMCQTVIGVDMTFCQILDRILTEGPSMSLNKLEKPPAIKNKP